MFELSPGAYLWIKAFHVIAVMAWMAGLLYLPRLFVYHAGAESESDQSATFRIMERRLLWAIVNPAMIFAVALGLVLLEIPDASQWYEAWLLSKLAAVVLLLGFHGACVKWQKDFAAARNRRSAKFYRMVNEFPTILMIAIVIMAVVKPF